MSDAGPQYLALLAHPCLYASSDVTVSNVKIIGNKVTSSTNALRIKTKATATGSTVSGVTYTDNTASGITDYGVIIDQSYPKTNGASP